MARDRELLPPADAEEARAAAALAEALEGRSRELDGCGTDLETAAFLRFSAGHGALNAERSARIRMELLEAVPRSARERPARRWRVWLPALIGASLAALVVQRAGLDRGDIARGVSSTERAAAVVAQSGPKGEMSPEAADDEGFRSAPSARGAGDSQGEAMGPFAAAPRRELEQVALAAQQLRATLLARANAPALMRAHAALDAASSAAEVEAAVHSSRELLDGTKSSLEGAEGPLLQQDLFCRLAEAALRLNQPQQALEWTERGLALDGEPNPFLAQLLSVEGQARASLGDRSGAARSYLRALEINESLLREHLDGP